MPDWRPDWQRAEAYIFADALGLRYSAWEFLRRNSDYQKDWEEALRLFQRAGPEVAQHGFPRVRTLDPSSEHFIIIGSLAAADELRKRWGIQGFVNPEHNRPRQLIFQHPNEIVAIKANAGNDPITIKLAENEVLVKFKMDMALESQMASAKMLLSGMQEDSHIRVRKQRRHKASWRLYLRILDAKAAGATYKEMMVLFEPSADADLIKKVGDTLQRAKRMTRPAGYLGIL